MSKWDIVYKTAAFVALIVGIYWTLRQLRDKRPRLMVSIEKTYVSQPTKSPTGGSLMHPVPGFKIYARNPTEKLIKIEKMFFVDGKKDRFILPKEWEKIVEVPSQENRSDGISLAKFNEWAKVRKLPVRISHQALVMPSR